MMETLKINHPFKTETGAVLPSVEIAYNTWGKLNAGCNNVIWVCHALTANSDVESWWPDMVGDGLLFDPKKYFIVCANRVTGRQDRLRSILKQENNGSMIFR
jgi:homoserine O-acetyltransferase